MNFLYLAGSLAGIALIVGLNLILFGRAKPVLGSVPDIAARLAADVPGFRAGRGVTASSGDTALIEDEASGAIFLVKALGDRVVTRKLSRVSLGEVRAVGSTLALRLRDFAFRGAVLSLPDERASREWEKRLKQVA